jgi:hypothetical protein
VSWQHGPLKSRCTAMSFLNRRSVHSPLSYQTDARKMQYHPLAGDVLDELIKQNALILQEPLL